MIFMRTVMENSLGDSSPQHVDQLSRLLALPGYVALVVEVAEKYNEADAVRKHNCIHGIREITLSEEVVSSVKSQQDKLDL